jgi:cysteine-rich repeat protein
LTSLGRCVVCSSTAGLYQLVGECLEFCGDGIRLKSTTGCDDGNRIPGDGCSTDCKIEDGWECSGGNDFTKDTCISVTGPTPIVTLDPKNPTRVVISFTKKISNEISDKEVYQQLVVSLEGISSKDASYVITYDPAGQEYNIDFDFKKSVVGAYININFADASRISDGFSNVLTSPKITLPFPSYYYVSVPVKETTQVFRLFSYGCQGFNVFMSFSLFLQGKQNYFWVFMEFFQRVQYVIYVNIKNPYFSEQFMDSFFPLQLKWLPNIPKYLGIEYNTASQLSEGGFYDQDKDAFYLYNIGTQISVWAIAIGIWIIARFIRLFLNAFESYASKRIILYLVRISEWSLLLRLITIMFFDFAVMTFLQLSRYDNSSDIMSASSNLSLVGLGFLLIFPAFVYFKVKSISKEGRLNTDTKFDVLHLDFKRTSRFSTKFLVLILFQKIVYAAILVGLQVNPETQLGLLAAQQIIMIFIYLILRPYADNVLNVKVIWQEFSLFGVFSLLYGVLDINADDNIRTDAARVIVALLMMSLVAHTLSMFIEAIRSFRIGSDKEDVVLSKKRLINKKRREAKQRKYENLSGEHKELIPENGKRSNLDQTERHQLIDNQSKDILTTNKNELSFV